MSTVSSPGGLSRDHARWIRSHPRFFLPIAVLRRVFRGKFVAALKSAFERGQLHLAGELVPLAHPKFFAAWLRPLFRKDWIVYSKPPFGGPVYVLQYLGRYTHRVAISNHRLVALADGQVTFRWRDSADHNRHKVMTVSRDEFLRRFLLHLLPKGFVRIRHFGFLANRRRAALLPRCFAALHATPSKNVGNFDRSYSAPAVALSQVRRTHGGRRAIHGGTTPTSFSTAPGRRCMKSIPNTPHCRRASERLAEVCLCYTRTSSCCPRLGSLRPSTPLCTGALAATPAALTTPPNFNPSASLHSICIRPASAAPAASF